MASMSRDIIGKAHMVYCVFSFLFAWFLFHLRVLLFICMVSFLFACFLLCLHGFFYVCVIYLYFVWCLFRLQRVSIVGHRSLA